MTTYYIELPLSTIQSLAITDGYTVTSNGVSFPGETFLYSSYGLVQPDPIDVKIDSAYNQANSSTILAQAAYDQANTGTGLIANIDGGTAVAIYTIDDVVIDGGNA